MDTRLRKSKWQCCTAFKGLKQMIYCHWKQVKPSPTLPSTVTNVHTKQAVQTADLCSNEAVSLVDHLLHRLHIILSQPAGRVPDNLYTNTLFSFKVCPKKQEPCFPSIKFHDFVKKVELEGINFFFSVFFSGESNHWNGRCEIFTRYQTHNTLRAEISHVPTKKRGDMKDLCSQRS